MVRFQVAACALSLAALFHQRPVTAQDEGPEKPVPPSEEAPSEEAPSEEAPSEEAPSEEAPSEEAPSEEAPSEEAPSEEPASEELADGEGATPEAGETVEEGAAGTAEPGAEEPGASEPGAAEPGAAEPGTEEPGAEEPGAEEPGAEEPGAEEPSAAELGAEVPAEAEPVEDAPSDASQTEPEVEEPVESTEAADADFGVPETPEPAENDDDKPEEESGIRVTLAGDLSAFLGQGTFVANSGARNPYVGWLLTLRPMAALTKKTRVFVIQNFSQELTNTDTDVRNYRVLASDTLFGGRVSYYTWPKTKTTFDAGVIMRLPTSISSRYQTLVFAVRPGLGLTQPIIPGLTFLARTEFRKNFHRYTSPVGKVDDVGDEVFLGRQGGNELIGGDKVSPGGNNTSYAFWNRALLSYSFLDSWSANGLILVVNGFTYENFALDEMSGTGAKSGRGRRDQALTELNVSHTWNGAYTLAGGVVTQGSLTPADGRGVRFPFFDFSSTARNLTSFFVRFSVAYPVLGAPQQKKVQTTPNVANQRYRSRETF